MPEEVTIREDLQVIQVTSYGDITTEDFKKTLDAILRTHQEQGLTKVLINGTEVTSYPTTFPVYDFGSQVASSLRGMKIAIAMSLMKQDVSVFFETVVINRGGIVKVFDSPDAALAWLLKEPNKTKGIKLF
jgi:hypothetical protein